MKPAVGRIVHYVSHGTPLLPDGSQAFVSRCRAAMVTEVDGEDPDRVGLCAVNPTGLFFHPLSDGGCVRDDGAGDAGSPDCPDSAAHGDPLRYCACGWSEPGYRSGTWHWPERVE